MKCRQELVKLLPRPMHKHTDRVDRDRHLAGSFLIAPILDAMETKRLRLIGWKLAQNFAEPFGKLCLLSILRWRRGVIGKFLPVGQ